MEVENLDVTATDETELDLKPSQEEADFIASLGEDTTEPSAEPQPQNSAQMVLVGLNGIEQVTQMLVHKDFAWPSEQKQTAAEQIAPAIAKHGGQLPEWLEPYKEELGAFVAISTLGLAGYLQVKELRKLEEAQAKNKQTAKPDDVGVSAVAT